MFDVGFSELVVCFLVALVVLGPQRLPEIARTMGRWTGRAKSYMRTLTAELEREAEAGQSLVRDIREAGDAMRSAGQSVRDEMKALGSQVEPKPGDGPKS